MDLEPNRVLAWFSCGAASAVAAKLALETYGSRVEVVYCNTLSTEHPDNTRFFKEVEAWLGVSIVVLQSPRHKDIDSVFEKERYMSGIGGAKCTTELKKLPRLAYQRLDDLHIFGYTVGEEKRAANFERNNPDLDVEWILQTNGVTKAMCLEVLKLSGIALPAMYSLGFEHNNCLGCVKSQSPGYWNKVRRLFPEIWERRVRQSRSLGVRLVKLHGKRVYLDEVPLEAYAPDDDIDCGPVCIAPPRSGTSVPP